MNETERDMHAADAAWVADARALLDESAAGLAATAVFLVALVPWHARAPGASALPAEADGTAAIVDAVTADDIEFFEDLEFYAWLDAQDPEIDG